MKNILGYDSKVMQVLSKLGDLILLNILFLICCVPVFTIGAAQAAMHRAVVAMKDPESDYTWFRAFCMGFKDGFWRITIAWCILLVMILAVGMNAFSVIFYEKLLGVEDSALWISIAGACSLMMIQSVMTLFHSRFGCTFFQLFRNALMLMIFNFLRCVCVFVMVWLPAVVFLIDISLFIQLTPLWILG